MSIVKRPVNMVSAKILANVSENFAKAFGLPEGHRSVGFFSADNDDVAYLAADDATKKARIRVIHAQTIYGGRMYAGSPRTGTVYILFSAEKIQDIRSAMDYIKDFVKADDSLFCFDDDKGTGFYAKTVARTGSFFEEWANIPKGMAYSYLVGPPVETNLALDMALKSGDVKVGRFFPSPTHANSCGAILFGREAACRTATRAFIDGLGLVNRDPLGF